MIYAVILSGGKQYRVTEGEEILLENLKLPKGKEVIIPEVLLLRSDDKVEIGTPLLKNVQVVGRVVDNVLGDKVVIEKFKAKVNYRRKIGFRAKYTKVKIEKISGGKGIGNKIVATTKTAEKRRGRLKMAVT